MDLDIEQAVQVFPIDQDLQGRVDALIKDGWTLVPGVAPVAIYHVLRVRQPAQPGIGALGKIKIDDAKIFIVPGTDKKQ